MNNRKGYLIDDQYASYFLTFTIVGWVDLFTRKECKDILVDSVRYCRDYKGLIVYSYVVMESHVHLILSAKNESDGLSSIIRDFKKFTSKKLMDWVFDSGKESRRDWLEVFSNIMQNSIRKI